MATVLKNARVVLPDREVNADVLVADGRIAAIGDGLDGAEQIDLAGATLLPGFIDVHIHGAVGVDVMEATAAGLREVSVYLASQGVTSWLPTLVPGSDENYASVAAMVSECLSDREGARVLGLHYEGPFVNTAQCGALHTEYFKTYSGPADLESLPVPENAVHMITMAPEIAGGVDLVRELKRRGWVISIGHTRAGLEVLDEACEAGARHMTHFMNAMAPLHHRSPGPIAWGLSRDDVTVDLIADGIHLDPFMLRLLLKLKGAAGISLISDAIAAAGKGDGDYEIWGETISVKNGRTANACGKHCRFGDQHARRGATAAFTRRFLCRPCANGLIESGPAAGRRSRLRLHRNRQTRRPRRTRSRWQHQTHNDRRFRLEFNL